MGVTNLAVAASERELLDILDVSHDGRIVCRAPCYLHQGFWMSLSLKDLKLMNARWAAPAIRRSRKRPDAPASMLYTAQHHRYRILC